MRVLLTLLRWFSAFLLTALLAGLIAVVATYLIVARDLPDVEQLLDVQLQTPLRIYDRYGELLAEYGEKRRIPVRYDEIPPMQIKAFLAAEDDRFFSHPGVDYKGLLRAAISLAMTGERRQGGSTITMQVARNFFLSPEKTYTRKLREIFLALKMERVLSKEEILELYLNKIYLGQRAYGLAAAAEIYYGKRLAELELEQMAMLAGLPKAPSRDNPISNPERATVRRDYVLQRMRDLGWLDADAYQMAMAQPISAGVHRPQARSEMQYVAEMVRLELAEAYGKRLYELGLSVYTTVEAGLQVAANDALRGSLLAYDRRHGWRGAEQRIDLSAGGPPKWREQLADIGDVGGLRAALVLSADNGNAELMLRDGTSVKLTLEDVSWARPYVNPDAMGAKPKSVDAVLQPGDVVRLAQKDDAWTLSQVPGVQGALVAMEPMTGRIRALIGGFDYFDSKFNRVTQALRQPGSSFKPFIYAAALHKGYTAATLVNDAPVVFRDSGLEGAWRPQNYSRTFYGPTRLREALYRSRNLVSIRVLRDVGVRYTREFATRFGFDSERLVNNLSLALGNASVTPMEMASGYSVFANGGLRVTPSIIERVVSADGTDRDWAQERPATGAVDPGADPRAIDEQEAFIMSSILRDVVQRGTAQRAKSLGRNDLAGKTGTTNDQIDSWFCGFHPSLTTVTWMGFDQIQPMGRRETGSQAALPMWISFMGKALEGVPEVPLQTPPGVVTMRIDPDSGQPVAALDAGGTLVEYFREGQLPEPGMEGEPGRSFEPARIDRSRGTGQGSIF